MEIRTRYKVVRKKLSELEIMHAYIIFDPDTSDNNLLITDIHKNGTVFSKASNEVSLCLTRLDKEEQVDVVGKVADFDIVNLKYDTFFGDVS